MRRKCALLAGIFAICSERAHAQEHQHEAGATISPLHVSAQTIGLITTAWPTAAQHQLTEAYLTQPFIMGMFQFPAKLLTLNATLNLEGLTLKRGELSPGIWGEGYVDRRHPHTFFHELALTAHKPTRVRGFDMSISLGKGFVPFGSDDPMARPLVKYPANHHLAQILERFVGIAAVRMGPVAFEYARFNGDEPQSPGDFPNFDRFGDSWSSRVTLKPEKGVEFQSSYAFVTSPENANGGGLDQKKFSVAARYDSNGLYGLVEFARTSEESHGTQSFNFRSFLAEGSLKHEGWTFVNRFEITERPDEERLANPFRVSVPGQDFHINGISRWPILSAGVTLPDTKVEHFALAPLAEISVAWPTATIRNSVFSPRQYYRAGTLWTVSAGIKMLVGSRHDRMGRYGIMADH